MEHSRFFVEPGFVSRAVRVEDDQFAQALDNFVLTCREAVVCHKGRVLLGLRKDEPMKKEWCTFGGRAIPGESFGATSARIFKRELGFAVDPGRFQLLPFPPISVVWTKRAQPPCGNGCHMETTLNLIELSESEVSRIGPDESHGKLEWFDPFEVVTGRVELHPFMAAVMHDVFTFAPSKR